MIVAVAQASMTDCSTGTAATVLDTIHYRPGDRFLLLDSDALNRLRRYADCYAHGRGTITCCQEGTCRWAGQRNRLPSLGFGKGLCWCRERLEISNEVTLQATGQTTRINLCLSQSGRDRHPP